MFHINPTDNNPRHTEIPSYLPKLLNNWFALTDENLLQKVLTLNFVIIPTGQHGSLGTF